VSAAAANVIAMILLLIVSITALADASHAPRPWRIAPALLCGSTGFWLADRSLAFFEMATTAAQMPAKAYIPAVVVIAAAGTVAGLLWRLKERSRNAGLARQSAVIDTLLDSALKRARRVEQ